MKSRTMISRDVTAENDMFMSLSSDAQSLYFLLNLSCDPIGVFTYSRRLLAYLGKPESAFDELKECGFVIRVFESENLFLITDFWVSNNLDRTNQKASEYAEDIDEFFVFQSQDIKKYVPKECAGSVAIPIIETLYHD